ncbi:MAG: D-2-hydroxyacid dehydrogenase family protein [Ottowia sp.]|nr:D-2-hydroxyacid dehydrogenase family protein [Ottowia sp.]
MAIVILDDYQDAVRKLACASQLDPYPAKVHTHSVRGVGRLAMRLRDAEVLVLIRERTALTRELIEKLPRLRMVSQVGEVGEHVDLDACTERGIVVAEGVGSPIPTAELTWALILAAARRLPQYISHLKQGAWQQSGLKAASMPPNFGLGTILHGHTLGVWGYGRVGRIVAGYGRAFGMNVRVWGSPDSMRRAHGDGHACAASRDALLAQSDFLTLHLRLSQATRGMLGLQDLARMKPTATLVNTSRAELLQPQALVAALQRGRPGMAAVDVFEQEPILRGHALLRLENCICTPHIGHVEQQNYELQFSTAFDNIVNYLRRQPSHVVNPQALAPAP